MEQQENNFSKWQFVLLIALFFAVVAQAELPNHESPDNNPQKEMVKDIKGAVVVQPEDKALKLEEDQGLRKSKTKKKDHQKKIKNPEQK